MTPLRQRMLEDMQVRHLAPRTQQTYIEQVARLARHFGRSPALLGGDHRALPPDCHDHGVCDHESLDWLPCPVTPEP
jgi:hypothetical protein